MTNKKVGVPKTVKDSIKDKKEQINLTHVIVGVVKFIEVAQLAMQRIFTDKRQVTDEQKYNLIKIEGRVEGYRDLLLHYFGLTPSWLNQIRDKVRADENFDNEVADFGDKLVPIKSVLITQNIIGEMSSIKARKNIIGA